MGTRRLALTPLPRRELVTAGAAAAATALIAYAGVDKLGLAGLLAPLAVLLGVILILRPLLAVSLVTVTIVVCEGPTFGLFSFTSDVYNIGFKDLTLIDGLVALAAVSVGLDVIRRRRTLRVPRPLVVPYVLLVTGMIAGVVVGHAAGASLRFAISSEHILAYLLLVPLAVANLDLDRRKVQSLLAWLAALASFKALMGLVEVATHRGTPIEGVTTLTYYEPAANWLIMIAILTIFAAVLARAKPPLWLLLSSPLLVACLVLSYRRSFWIGAVLGLLLLVMLGTTPVGRRMLVPTALAVAAAIWLLGSIHFQNSVPIVKRAASLNPTKIEASVQDRYRLNERANVIAEIRRHPITGLGATIPWQATAQTLSKEGEGDARQYVHFAALWFWLKMGILGLFAYVGLIVGSMLLAWQAWRRSKEPLLRAFGVASLCGIVGLVAIDTTASFTGVEARFTILFAAQVGLLAVIAGTAGSSPDPQPSIVGAPERPPLAPMASAAR
jgi:O-antigen ligase